MTVLLFHGPAAGAGCSSHGSPDLHGQTFAEQKSAFRALVRPLLCQLKCKTGPKSVDQLSSLIDSISLVSCVDELDQLPIRSGVATGVANELSGVTPANPGHPPESPLVTSVCAENLLRSEVLPPLFNQVFLQLAKLAQQKGG